MSGLIRDTLEKTHEVNRELAVGAGWESDVVVDYISHVEGHDVAILPRDEPLAIIGFAIGCRACNGSCVITFHTGLTEVSLPQGCQANSLVEGDMAVGSDLLADTGRQG